MTSQGTDVILKETAHINDFYYDADNKYNNDDVVSMMVIMMMVKMN